MKHYDRVLSHAQTALTLVSGGRYKNEVILFAFDYSGFTDEEHLTYRERVLLCTERRVLCVKDLSHISLQLRLSDLAEAMI